MEGKNSLPPSYNEVKRSPPNVRAGQIPTHMATTTFVLNNPFNPTLKPYPNFNVRDDVQFMIDAFKPGADKNTIMEVLCRRTSDQRTQICQEYYNRVGHYLIEDVKKNFYLTTYYLLSGLSMPYYEYLARCIHRGISLKWLYDILLTLSNEEIVNMKHYFQSKYLLEVEYFIRRFFRGNSGKGHARAMYKPLMRLLEARRNENFNVSPNEVANDVERLANISPPTCSCKQAEKMILKEIFYYKSWPHIRAVCETYQQKYNHPVFDVIERCYFTIGEDIFSKIARYALSKDFYFAELLKISMKGLGTDDALLTHIIVKRSEIDLADIKTEFQNVYKESLVKWVRDDTSGHYQYGLCALMGEN